MKKASPIVKARRHTAVSLMSYPSRRSIAAYLCWVVWGSAALALAQTTPAATSALGDGEASEDVGVGRIRTRADTVSYDRKNNVVEGTGNVIVRKGDIVLRCDYVRVDTLTEVADAQGNVTITRWNRTHVSTPNWFSSTQALERMRQEGRKGLIRVVRHRQSRRLVAGRRF